MAPVVYEAHADNDVVVPQEYPVEVVTDWTQERIEKEIRKVSDKYGVSYDKMWHTVKCESGFDTDIQSHHILQGKREESFGLAQFNLPSRNRTVDGKVITKEMALDPAIALDAMAFHFSKGNARAWSCYRMLYK
jgi:hypothetical protein